MNKKILRGLTLVLSLCALAVAASGQQPSRTRRGGLDNLSLPSTSARVSAATATGAAWQTFAPEGAGFSVSLPGLPEEPTADGRASGQLAAQFRSYRLAAGGLKYEVARTPPLPEQLVSQSGFTDKFFASASENLTRSLMAENPNIKFRLVSQHAVSLDGYEGRELEFAAEGHRAVARVFLVERSIYALGVLGAKGEMTPDKVNRFLDSLALTQ
ncbi:MAG TPA: hypothetical protein VF634_02410 [Pyrinomonadaceae bacterium]